MANDITKDYDQSVAHLAYSKTDMEFNNKGVPHAVTVIKNIFDTTESSVKMFSEKLDSSVADNPDFLISLEKYLDSGKSFELLLEKLPKVNEQSEALKKVIAKSKEFGSKVLYKELSLKNHEQMKNHFTNKEHTAYHFIVSDNRAFRIETDPSNFKAVCNFNNKEVASLFTKLFDKYFKES